MTLVRIIVLGLFRFIPRRGADCGRSIKSAADIIDPADGACRAIG